MNDKIHIVKYSTYQNLAEFSKGVVEMSPHNGNGLVDKINILGTWKEVKELQKWVSDCKTYPHSFKNENDVEKVRGCTGSYLATNSELYSLRMIMFLMSRTLVGAELILGFKGGISYEALVNYLSKMESITFRETAFCKESTKLNIFISEV